MSRISKFGLSAPGPRHEFGISRNHVLCGPILGSVEVVPPKSAKATISTNGEQLEIHSSEAGMPALPTLQS